MVVLDDLFKFLSSGEFSNLALSRKATGGLAEEEYARVIGHINLGILEIHKRFKFLENEVTVHLYPDVERYYLRQDRVALPHNISRNTYIELPDDSDGLLNIIEISAIFDSLGTPLALNNRYATPVVRQLSTDILKITGITSEQTISVVYQSYPSRIEITDEDFDPKDCAIYIPESIIEPLLFYVAARTYKPMGSNDSSANADKSASYEQKYELAMQKLEVYGLDPDDSDDENTFIQDGWV